MPPGGFSELMKIQVINTKSSEEINMNYYSEIILIDPNIFQPLSPNYWPMF